MLLQPGTSALGQHGSEPTEHRATASVLRGRERDGPAPAHAHKRTSQPEGICVILVVLRAHNRICLLKIWSQIDPWPIHFYGSNGKKIFNTLLQFLLLIVFPPLTLITYSLTYNPGWQKVMDSLRSNPAASRLPHDKTETTLCFLPYLILLIPAHILHHSQLLENMSQKNLPSPKPKLKSM